MSTPFDPDAFIALKRSFHELRQSEDTNDDTDLKTLRGEGRLHWDDLIALPRVVLLSEAGSGKTVETRAVCRTLRAEGKAAFFIRIEHVTESFEDAFEEGTFADFETWTTSGGEGWLLLDSVDEARLRAPRDFELAVKKLGRKLASVLPRAHILITGRTVAWRPKTDLMLVKQHLPYTGTRPETLDLNEGADARAKGKVDGIDGFKIVALEDLHGEQVDQFARAKGVTDLIAFKAALDRKDAWTLTTRPLDLAEVCEYWAAHGEIASRYELMKSSIDRRLEEIDQDRADARPITVEKLRQGAKLVAAAATLAQESGLRVPDGAANAKGLPVKQVLADWDDTDIATLLSRPIFDEGIYGTVRFHHRSVREFLTAEWLHNQIINQASRTRIEALFFREQYGLEVIVPTTRPILPWLCLLDPRILARTIRLAPEILFEGGDASQLPADTRAEILRQTCEQLAQPAHGRSMLDYMAVQRFAHSDLVDEIRSLLSRHADDEEIVAFLLRMIWIGELKDLVAEAKSLAIKLTAEFLTTLPVDDEGIAWCMSVLEVAQGRRRFDVDPLAYNLPDYIERIAIKSLPGVIASFQRLLATPPVIERSYCDISKQYVWLAGEALRCITRLIEARDEAAFSEPALWILRNARELGDHTNELFRESRKAIGLLVPAWPELNHALFWYDVAETRAHRDKKEKSTVDLWEVGLFGRDWAFGAADFPTACDEITSRPLSDDRLIALSLAFQIYRTNNRPEAWRRRMRRAVAGDMALEAALQARLHPKPHPDAGKWRKQEARWKAQTTARVAKNEASRRNAVEILKTRVDMLRDFGKDDAISQDQWYLHCVLREGRDEFNRWSVIDWRRLEPEFGENVARAFRDGAVGFWRRFSPVMRSQGGPPNSTPVKVIFGISGLNMEAAEVPDWTSKLTSADATIAAKYGLCELNGFSAWLPEVHRAFPAEVEAVVLAEIDHELATSPPNGESHYVLYDVARHGAWMFDGIAPAILKRLATAKPSPINLGYLLAIINRSSLPDMALTALAERKAKAIRHDQLAPMWFAQWVGLDPDVAIPALASRLAALKAPELQTQFAMRFVTRLVGGGRIGTGYARQAYRQVRHMKELLLLMHRYIRQADDIERAGRGVYSPGLRDDAQDARNALLSFIVETTGKEAFLALMDIAADHPDTDSRPWTALRAKNKAAQDADFAPWSVQQVREFAAALERTPANHHELWYLAVDRLTNLKHDLEGGDASLAAILARAECETEVRNFIGGWCRDRAAGRYVIPQEEEMADAKRPDLRFHGVGFDGPVPAELKIADAWTGPHLFERLENQLCGDYLRDVRSSRGVFVLVHTGKKAWWEHPSGGRLESFDALVGGLRQHWERLATKMANVEDIVVIGIDLTKRLIAPGTGA
ncbi:hypothetical protein UAJ10_07130 [Nitrospirillum sp. BR 11164]|uniref:NACHT domain-containing protein n=1 Tax=Nitrospirillum sp. BR 11164 TaxID=3104324 RepID=UPI002AFE996C|nr:hypothetical protein [Nitrospirillum sp. BR 11164]MEA1648788.1 hypothetical protein [Nitrospirillum sp. BR 11164]